MERETPQSIEQYVASLQRLNTLLPHLARVTDDATKGLIERGLTTLDQTIESLGAQEEVQDYMITQDTEAHTALTALTDLEGLVPAEEIEAQRQSHLETISFVAAFVTRHNITLRKEPDTVSAPTAGASTSSVSTPLPVETTPPAPVQSPEPSVAAPFPADEWTPTAQPEPAAEKLPVVSERETVAQPLELTLIEGDVTYLQIGKRGLLISLKGHVVQPKQQDYSVYRQRALEYLVSRQGEPVRVKDLENALGDLPEGRTIGAVMHHVRDWLESLTFRNSRLFRHNKSRGVGSAYETNRAFAMSLHRRIFTKDSPTRAIVVEEDISTDSPPPKNIEEIADQFEISKLETSPIPLRAAAVCMSLAVSYSDLLVILGIPAPDKELAEMLSDSSAAEDIKQNIDRSTMTDTERQAERAEVLRNMRAFLSQTTLFEELIVNTPETSPLYPFITYLVDIHSEESWDNLLNQVMNVMVTQKEVGDVTRGGLKVRGYIETIILPNGRIFERRNIDGKSEPLVEITAVRTREFDIDEEPELLPATAGRPLPAPVTIPTPEISSPEQPEVETQPEATPHLEESPAESVDEVDVSSEENYHDEIQEPVKRDREAERLQRFEAAFDERLKLVVQTVIVGHAPLEGNVGHLRNYFPWLTRKNIREALENNVLSDSAVTGKGTVHLGIEHVIRIGIWRLDPNLYNLERKGLVERIVTSLARDIQTARENPSAGLFKWLTEETKTDTINP